MIAEISRENTVRIAMHGRLLRCSMGGNPLGCPLYTIRQLPVKERLDWLDSKTDEELEALFEGHLHCLEEKEAAA